MTRFPWPSYRDPWECIVTEARLDGSTSLLEIDGDHLRVEAFEKNWQTAELDVEVLTSEPIPAELDALDAHVLLACAATQLRRSYRLKLDGNESTARFRGTLTIPRTALAGKGMLNAEVVAEHGGRLRVVGSSVPWGIVVDKGEAPDRPGVPPLKTVWVDFSAPEAPPEARKNTEGFAYVDVAASPPILYLNKEIDGFQLLILSNNAKLERRRHRDMLGAMIARYVASALFRAAVEQVTPDEFDGRPEGPSGRVLKDICEAVAAELPDTETVEDLYQLLTELVPGTSASSSFWASIDLALDRMTSMSSTIARVCDEAKRV